MKSRGLEMVMENEIMTDRHHVGSWSILPIAHSARLHAWPRIPGSASPAPSALLVGDPASSAIYSFLSISSSTCTESATQPILHHRLHDISGYGPETLLIYGDGNVLSSEIFHLGTVTRFHLGGHFPLSR